MPSKQFQPVELIDKYFAGTCNNTEKQSVQDWLTQVGSDNQEFLVLDFVSAEMRSVHHSETEPLTKIKAQLRRKRFYSSKVSIMISIFILIIVDGFFFFQLSSADNTRRLITLENASLFEVISALENEYKIRIDVADQEMFVDRVTATFYAQSPEEVITTISQAIKVKYIQKRKNTFVLYKSRLSDQQYKRLKTIIPLIF